MDETIYYAPIAGTDHPNDPWVVDGNSPLTRFLRIRGFEPLRLANGVPWTWRATLQGLWWQGQRIWREDAAAFRSWMETVPYTARNAFGHSHGGQLAIIAAANGLKLRTLTTFGTPVRRDVDAEAAAKNIGLWQHVFDVDKDWTASMKRLGQLGDWRIRFDRRFLIPGVINIGVKGIDHSRLLRDESVFYKFDQEGILTAIRAASNEPR